MPTKHDSDAMEELDDDDAERRDTVTAAVAAAESKIIRSKRASGLPPQYFIPRTTPEQAESLQKSAAALQREAALRYARLKRWLPRQDKLSLTLDYAPR